MLIEVVIKVEQYIIKDYAILEIRHFNKELGLRYQQIIFYNKNKLIEEYKYAYNDIPIYTNCKYGVHISEPEKYDYIELDSLKSVISDITYCQILIDLFKKSPSFYETNIIFPYLYEINDLTENQVNEICLLSLKVSNLKSFTLQRLLPKLVGTYNGLIKSELLVELIKYYNIV